MEEKKIPAPVSTATDGVAIHLSYIRRDIDEIKANQIKSGNEVKEAISRLQDAYVTRVDFDEHEKRDEDHEIRIRSIEKNVQRWIGISSVLSSIGGALLLALAQYFIK